MNQSVIKSIQPNGTWEGRNGLMYKSEIELEDGTIGEVSSKTQDRWSVGDDVAYTTSQTAYGTRMQLNKPQYGGGGGGNAPRKTSPDVQRRIDASWAVGQAVQMLGKVNDLSDGTLQAYEHDLELFAKRLLDIRNRVSNEG